MNNKITILLIEDEKTIVNFMSSSLSSNDYRVISCETGKESLKLMASHCPDLVLLDLGLPDIDGLEVLKKFRTWSEIPVIVVSARDSEMEKVRALDYGADDYITKPFGTSELLARIRTALRHYCRKLGEQNGTSPLIYQTQDLTINLDTRQVTIHNKKVHLTQIEFKLLALLARSSGKVLTYDYIIREIWGPYAINDNQILRVNMANIRRKIEINPADPQYIFTEIGVGYRMAGN